MNTTWNNVSENETINVWELSKVQAYWDGRIFDFCFGGTLSWIKDHTLHIINGKITTWVDKLDHVLSGITVYQDLNIENNGWSSDNSWPFIYDWKLPGVDLSQQSFDPLYVLKELAKHTRKNWPTRVKAEVLEILASK